jgi:hypothetical protein
VTAPAPSEPESRWLVIALAGMFIAIGLLLLAALVVLDWPCDQVGNALQLVGLAIAALGVPVVPPWLAGVERRLAAAARKLSRWIEATAEQVRRRWDRLRGNTRVPTLGGTATARGRASGTVTIKRGTVDRNTIETREWLGVMHDQVDALWATLDHLQESTGAERRKLDERLLQQRRELQAHTLAVTRGGWHYIVGGAGCTAIGIGLTLLP